MAQKHTKQNVIEQQLAETAHAANSNCVVAILKGLAAMFRGQMGNQMQGKTQFHYAYSDRSQRWVRTGSTCEYWDFRHGTMDDARRVPVPDSALLG